MSKPRKHKPVFRLSRIDSERLERGEIAGEADAAREALTEASGEVAHGSSRDISRKTEARDANEQRLLDELPPHFGKL